MSVKKVVDYLVSNRRLLGSTVSGNIANLKAVQTIINSAVNQTKYSAGILSKIIGINQSQMEGIYLLYFNENGHMVNWNLIPQKFIDFTVEKVLPNKAFVSYFDKNTSKQLIDGKTIIDAVVSKKKYSNREMYKLLTSFTEELSESNTEIMYLNSNVNFYAKILNLI